MSSKRKRRPNIPDSTLRRYRGKSARPTSNSDFDPDYSYVVQDLRRIGTLAGIFIAGLLILSLILS